jgi:hypothetical protein
MADEILAKVQLVQANIKKLLDNNPDFRRSQAHGGLIDDV